MDEKKLIERTLKQIATAKSNIEKFFADTETNERTKIINVEYEIGQLFAFFGFLRMLNMDTFCEEYKKHQNTINLACEFTNRIYDL